MCSTVSRGFASGAFGGSRGGGGVASSGRSGSALFICVDGIVGGAGSSSSSSSTGSGSGGALASFSGPVWASGSRRYGAGSCAVP
jgi:hypothetical protein